MFTLTYHQVLPTFLDFLFPFGQQQYAQDFQFSGFRNEDRLSLDERGLCLPNMGRSGRSIQMCYNLKSVEPSKAQKNWPWSTRQTAAYHSFDVETGRAFWVVAKGDQLMKRRMEAATKPGSRAGSFNSLASSSFSSSLVVHLIIFDWCREHWRWFINFLEEELQKSTRHSLLVDLDSGPSRTAAMPSRGGINRITSSQFCISPTSVSEKSPWRTDSTIKAPLQYPHSARQPISTLGTIDTFAESEESLNPDEDFSFNLLQRVQELEEKANETLLVLESNINILSEVRQYYHEIVASKEFPADIRSLCVRDLAKFERNVTSIINDLQMQLSRTKMLLRLLTDRKTLVSSNWYQFNTSMLTGNSSTASWIIVIWNQTSYSQAKLSYRQRTWSGWRKICTKSHKRRSKRLFPWGSLPWWLYFSCLVLLSKWVHFGLPFINIPLAKNWIDNYVDGYCTVPSRF